MPEKPKPLIAQINADWVFEKSPIFEVIYGDKFTGGNISLQELTVICALVRMIKGDNAMEIGTFDGRTTCNIANNMPKESRVFTFDLPTKDHASLPLQIKGHNGFMDEELGFIGRVHKLFNGHTFPATIKQHWMDSAQINPDDYPKMDFIFVDGSHSYEYCKKDTETALAMIKPGGYILWHDYDGWPGVTQALNEIYQERNLEESMYWIKETSLVIFSFQAS